MQEKLRIGAPSNLLTGFSRLKEGILTKVQNIGDGCSSHEV